MTDPDARLTRKTHHSAAMLGYLASAVMENRNGLIVQTDVRAPHVSPNPMRYRPRRGKRQRALPWKRHPVDQRTLRHAGFAISQQKRKLIEQAFGWQKCVGPLRKLHHRGRALVSWIFTFTSAAYNLTRMRSLLAPT